MNVPVVCQDDLGGASSATASLSLCGEALTAGGTAVLQVAGSASHTPILLGIATTQTPVPLLGGTLVGIPVTTVSFQADASGTFAATLTGVGPAADVLLQALVIDPSFAPQLTNALRVELP